MIDNKQIVLNLSVTILMFLGSVFCVNTAYALDSKQVPVVKKVIETFKQNNKEEISKLISYPLLRQSPIQPINNQAEFIVRYDEVFDDYLLNIITQSNVYTDWDSIGWRGVILNNGIVALDPEGSIIDINYHSPREQALIAGTSIQTKAKGRDVLERNQVNDDKALVEFITPHTHIRIDSLGEGKGELRYSSWSGNKDISEAPDIVLNNGRIFTNNGRSQQYIFNNGTYQYQLNVDLLGVSANPTGTLEVFKGGQFLKREVATQVISY